MTSRTWRGAALVILVPTVATLTTARPAGAQTWDLATDWSDLVNPNGPWRYLVDGALGASNVRGGDPFAAPGPPHIWGSGFFGWSRSIGTELAAIDVQAGDVYGHDNAGGPIAITWTSPAAGMLTVSGVTWGLREIGRTNDWTVTLGGASKASGTFQDGDGIDRAHPAAFGFSSPVAAGDVVAYTLNVACCVGDYAGLGLTIDLVSAVPEPATIGLVGIGVATLIPVVRRRRV